MILLGLGWIILAGCGGGEPSGIVRPEREVMRSPVSRVNVFVENSGSMYGYVRGDTEFKVDVYGFLSDLTDAHRCQSMSLYYINTNVFPQQRPLRDFIGVLSPEDFRNRGLSAVTGLNTDIYGLLDTVLRRTPKGEVSVFISDCIFSPGPKQSATEYLSQQRIGIKSLFHSQIRQRDLAVVVYQMQSAFNGKYFDRNNTPITLYGDVRPYYIWVLGNRSDVWALLYGDSRQSIRPQGVQHSFIAIRGGQKLFYKVLPNRGEGSYATNVSDWCVAEDAELGEELDQEDGGRFTMSVGVDFRPLLQDVDYLKDEKNFILKPRGWHLSMEETQVVGFSHIAQLRYDGNRLRRSRIYLTLLQNLPPWIETLNDNDDATMATRADRGKTYGLRELLGGIYDAYTLEGDTRATIEVEVHP